MFDRKYYKIGEVAAMLECSVEDILEAGYKQEVIIWVWANRWKEVPLTSDLFEGKKIETAKDISELFHHAVEKGPSQLINGPRQLTPDEIHQIRFGYQIDEDGMSIYISEKGTLIKTAVVVNDAEKISIENLIIPKKEVKRLEQEKSEESTRPRTIYDALHQDLNTISKMDYVGTMERHNIAIYTVLDAVKKVIPDFDPLNMPGVVDNFKAFCQTFDYPFPSGVTFKEYAKGKHLKGTKVPACSWARRKSPDYNYWKRVISAMKSSDTDMKK